MATNIPSLDFLDEIVNVHFATGGLLLLDITATATQNNSPPATPTITFNSLPKGGKIVDHTQTISQSSTPAHDTPKTIYFVWLGGAAFPTQSNYNSQIGPDPGLPLPFTYAGQFSVNNDRHGLGFTYIQDDFWVGNHDTGLYSDIGSASAAAANFNTDAQNSFPLGYYSSNGIDIISAPLGAGFGAQLTVTVHSPATFTTVLHAKYLISVPEARGNTTFTVTAGPGFSSVTASIYTRDGGASSIARLRHPADHTTSSGGAGTTAFVATTTAPKPGQGTVVLTTTTGGGSGGGG